MTDQRIAHYRSQLDGFLRDCRSASLDEERVAFAMLPADAEYLMAAAERADPPTPDDIDDLLARICATGYASEASEIVERWIEARYGVVGAFTAAERAKEPVQ